MTLNLTKMADEIMAAGVFSINKMPRIVLVTARELGCGTDGEYHPFGEVIYIRRRPIGGSLKFVLAHELAHHYQTENGLPLCERQADDLAFQAVGHGSY